MAVGPGGHFLNREYTIENIRKIWHPGISNRWSATLQDFRDPQTAAIEGTQRILNNHRPRRLDEKQNLELGKIVQTSEKELLD